MKLLLPISLFFLIFLPGRAQTSQELEKQLLSMPKNEKYVDIINQLSVDYFNADPEKSNQLSRRALALSDSLHYKKGTADALVGQSLQEQLRADYARELEFLMNATRLYLELKDDKSLAKIYSSIGVIHFHEHNYALSKSYFSKALTIFKSLLDKEGEATTLRRMGNVEADMLHHQEALNLYQASLKLEEEIHNEMGIANTLNNIGLIYYELNNYSEALAYYKRSVAITEKINNLFRLPAAYHNIGRVYLNEHKPDDALQYGQKALQLSEKLKLKPATLEATLLISEAYEQKGDNKNAYTFLKHYKLLRDSLQESENSARVAQLESLLTKERHEQQITLLQKEKEAAALRQRILVGGIIIVLVGGSLLIYFQYISFKRKTQLIQKEEELRLTRESLQQAEIERHRKESEFRNKELLIYTLSMAQKGEIMEAIRSGINEVLSSTDSQSSLKLAQLTKLIDYSLDLEKDWEQFRLYFEKVSSSFFVKLTENYPDLSPKEHKLCALLSLNLSLKELAELLSISVDSVKMAKYRLRKKMDIPSDEKLDDFLYKLKNS